MKVLHVINTLDTGGAENLLVGLLKNLTARGVNVELLMLSRPKDDYLQSLAAISCKVHCLNSKSVYSAINILRIVPYLKRYDLIHVHLFPANYWVGIAKFITRSKCKLVVTEHSTSNTRRKYKVFNALDKYIYQVFGKIITISQSVDESTKKHLKLPDNKFNLIYNGINLSSVSDAEASSDPILLSKMGEGDQVIIQVANFKEPKDQATLMRALLLLPRNIKLLLVGQGKLQSKLEELAVQLGVQDRIIFLGVRKDVPELLKFSDIIVLSTGYEGLSLSSIEGMASGRPFIASDVPGVTEVVEGAGILFPLGDDRALAFQINKLLNDRRYYDCIVDKCKKRSGLYSIENMATGYIDLYRSLVS